MSILATFFLETLLRPLNAHTAAHREIFVGWFFSELGPFFYFWNGEPTAARLPCPVIGLQFASLLVAQS